MSLISCSINLIKLKCRIATSLDMEHAKGSGYKREDKKKTNSKISGNDINMVKHSLP